MEPNGRPTSWPFREVEHATKQKRTHRDQGKQKRYMQIISTQENGTMRSEETTHCDTCENEDSSHKENDSLVPVWENPKDHERGEFPDYIGCTDCHTMRPTSEEYNDLRTSAVSKE